MGQRRREAVRDGLHRGLLTQGFPGGNSAPHVPSAIKLLGPQADTKGSARLGVVRRVAKDEHRRTMKREEGFTVIELLVVIMITSVLLTLGASAIRFFWLGRALHGERDQIFTGLRSAQQQVVSESNPLVFGAWFKVTTPATDDGSVQWGTVRYRPVDGTTPASCTSTGTHRLDGGVQIASASFADTMPGTVTVSDVISLCRTQVPAAAAATDFALFLSRGTATNGCVTLNQPRRDMEDVTVSVGALTGRVERLDEEEADAECA